MARMWFRASLFIAVVLSSLVASCQSKQSSGSWHVAASMQTGRSEIAAATLGSKVYTAGGIGFLRTLKSCEVYNVETNKWSRCADLPMPLHHVAIASDGQSIYAGGGYTDFGFTHLKEPPLWRRLTDMPTPRHSFAHVVIDDELWILGGRSERLGSNIAITEIYNIADKAWRKGPPLPEGRGAMRPPILMAVSMCLAAKFFILKKYLIVMIFMTLKAKNG